MNLPTIDKNTIHKIQMSLCEAYNSVEVCCEGAFEVLSDVDPKEENEWLTEQVSPIGKGVTDLLDAIQKATESLEDLKTGTVKQDEDTEDDESEDARVKDAHDMLNEIAGMREDFDRDVAEYDVDNAIDNLHDALDDMRQQAGNMRAL